MRDDFSDRVKDTLAKRVGSRCSNPTCGNLTSGPQENPEKSLNVGVAAHITAASSGGPRYDNNMTSEKRVSTENGIWLCQKCAKLIDNDPSRYTVETLHDWKKKAEQTALHEVEGSRRQQSHPEWQRFVKLEKMMPDFLDEMRDDLIKSPLKREFVLLKKCWNYSSDGHELVYYYDDHAELFEKVKIIQNYSLIHEIFSGNTKRYRMTENFVDYLTRGNSTI